MSGSWFNFKNVDFWSPTDRSYWLQIKPERLVSSRAWTLSTEEVPHAHLEVETANTWEMRRLCACSTQRSWAWCPSAGRHRPWLGLLGSLACSCQDFAHILGKAQASQRWAGRDQILQGPILQQAAPSMWVEPLCGLWKLFRWLMYSHKSLPK